MLISFVIVSRGLSSLGCQLAIKPAPALLWLTLEVMLRVLEKLFMCRVMRLWVEVLQLRLERLCR